MGSSKKHKDKGREEKKHKHRDRDKERKHHKRKRRRSRSRDRDEDRKKQKGSDSPILLADSPEPETTPATPDTTTAPEAPTGDGSFRESLSIEETNKLRVKLGLAPLKVDSGEKPEAEVSYDDRPDVHQPPVNLSSKKESEKIQEKLALIREKRKQHKKLQKVKTIAESAGDLEDASSWVKKSRKAQKEKEMADKQAKILQEMDEEFGISDLLDDELKKEKSEAYSAKDMAGLRVEHDAKEFRDGSSVILTLKDSGVLDDEGDTLVNYNMIDVEKAKKNIELKKKMPGYVAYDDTEEDEFGMLRPKSLLSKYDEEIDGERKRSFQLDRYGTVDTRGDRVTDSLKEQLKAQVISLESKPLTVASEYYTPLEMDSFKKPRKKKRRLKKKNVVDELVAMQAEIKKNEDHGSRAKKSEVEDGEIEEEEPKEIQVVDMELETPDEGAVPVDPPEDDWGPPIEDEAEAELQSVLNKARKLRQKKDRKKQRVEEQVAAVIGKIKVEPEVKIEPDQGDSKSIVLHSTSEFCRALGDIPTYGTSGNRNEDEDDDMDLEEREEDEIRDEVMEEVKGWNQVNPDEEEENKEDELGPVLEEEPDIRPGCMGALKLAVKKGYLGVEQTKNLGTVSSKNKHMEARNFVVEDKNYNDIDAKYNKHERGGYRGPLQDFKDKEGYQPDFKLTYIDESGRELNQKEAFRFLSHRFHGKGSGKLKTEKRMKKVLEEEAMKKMSSTDTPLHTVARMQEKQKEMQTPYIVLSGGGKNLATDRAVPGRFPMGQIVRSLEETGRPIAWSDPPDHRNPITK